MVLLATDMFPGLQDMEHLTRVFARLLVAVLLGGLLGYEREREGKAAGLRTHMLVALGSALFILVPLEAGVSFDAATRVIQGLVAGIGFLGAGTILQLSEQRKVKGLTTAANIWLTAAVGLAAGAGWIWPAVFGTLFALLILGFVHLVERWLRLPPPGSTP
jgi:putative Mg2+ transporter-C (MgtC) family protein